MHRKISCLSYLGANKSRSNINTFLPTKNHKFKIFPKRLLINTYTCLLNKHHHHEMHNFPTF